MEIFRVRLNTNEYQRFLPRNEEIWKTDVLTFECRPKQVNWEAPEIYVYNPRKQVGDFFHLASGAFASNAQATEQLRDILEKAGELLPLTHEGQRFVLLNVLECANCLDQAKTEWVSADTGEKLRILKYHFDVPKLPESTLFKIPETSKAEILCVEGIKDPHDEFKARVEAGGLKGFSFEKIWSNLST